MIHRTLSGWRPITGLLVAYQIRDQLLQRLGPYALDIQLKATTKRKKNAWNTWNEVTTPRLNLRSSMKHSMDSQGALLAQTVVRDSLRHEVMGLKISIPVKCLNRH